MCYFDLYLSNLLYGCLITLASCETKNATEDNTKWGEEKLLFSKKCNRNPMQVQWNLSTPNIRRTSFCVQIRQIQVKVTHISYIWTLLKFDFIQGSNWYLQFSILLTNYSKPVWKIEGHLVFIRALVYIHLNFGIL
jgi:hypothetical protein